MSMRAAIDRALMVLTRERASAIEARRKYEEGGNLYILIEKKSPAAIERVEQYDTEISELGQAIDYLEGE